MNYTVNEDGFYGEFGGAFVPEMLYPNVRELQLKYREIIESDEFQAEFQKLLRDYVGRPSPLYLAQRLSDKTGFRIYLKREDLNHTGSHKINNTTGQILLARALGKKRIIAETGAGQHGLATATVCALMNLECVVFMGAVDIERQKPNVEKMKMLGATVVEVNSGSRTLKDATNEALRDWIAHPIDTHYLIGSVVGPHPFPDMVARFQRIIGEEIQAQLRAQENREAPDAIVACVGGGSNSIGAFGVFLDDEAVKLFGVEAGGAGVDSGKTAATTAVGRAGVLHGSRTLLMQTQDGQVLEAHSVSAGLDYPGIGAQHSHLFTSGRVRYVNVTDDEALNAGLELTRLEGIIPAVESAHALAYLPKLDLPPGSVVVVCLSGRGDKDMSAYLDHFAKTEAANGK
jgi:tryptophan synthase beta chain